MGSCQLRLMKHSGPGRLAALWVDAKHPAEMEGPCQLWITQGSQSCSPHAPHRSSPASVKRMNSVGLLRAKS